MRKLLTWIIIFVLGFIIWAGVGFKILEWVSSEIFLEAWDNSYNQFQQVYPWSTAQKQLSQKVEEQKWILLEQIQNGLKDKLLKMFSIWEKEKTAEK